MPLNVESTGFDGFIAPCVYEMMVGDEKKWPFYQLEQGLDIGRFVHLLVLVNRPVKMCLKGDENIAEAGLRYIMRLYIAIRTVGMVNLRTSYMMRDALCLMHRIQCGIRRTQHNHRCYCGTVGGYHLRAAGSGFTVIELLIVVVIIAIAAMAAIPMMTSAAGFQIRSAANMIAADLEYAKTIAISRGQ
ncbi:MAG: prepilin-type N-terminal cleavage/methylation domain-containing protein, partial [Planctomycetota bacterium]